MNLLDQYVLPFIVIFGGLILIHEFGHFIVAKIFRIRVETFSIGFGTRLWGWRKGDTDYRISLIPLGGYVKLSGDTTDEEITGAPWEFMSHPKWQQLCVMFAGPVMNFLAALAIPLITVMVHYDIPAYVNKPAVIGAVDAGSPGDKAGLKVGDRIVEVDGYKNPTWGDFASRIALNPDQAMKLAVDRNGQIEHLEYSPAAMTDDNTKIGTTKGLRPVLSPKARLYVADVTPDRPAYRAGLKANDQIIAFNGAPLEQDAAGGEVLIKGIQGSGGKPVTLEVRREGQTISIQATPELDGGVYRLGFYSSSSDETITTRLPLPAALRYAYHQNIEIIRLTETAIAQVFSGQRKAGDIVAGPVQIFKFTGEAAKEGIGTLLWLTSVLSLNLGIFNLFPIPILDGGRIFMIALDSVLGIIGFRLSKTVKERVMTVGLVLIVALMAFVIINDVRHILPSKPQTQQTETPATNR